MCNRNVSSLLSVIIMGDFFKAFDKKIDVFYCVKDGKRASERGIL